MNLLDGGNDLPQEDMKQELIKKWADKSPDEVLNAKVESDLYIKTLEARLDDLRKDYTKMSDDSQTRANLQELLDKLNTAQKPPVDQNPNVNREDSPKFDPKEIDSMFERKISAYEQKQREEQNFNSVKNKLVEKFGSNYQTALTQQLEDLGLSAEDLNVMARTRPSFLMKALDLDTPIQRETFQAPPRSSQRNDNFAPKGAQKRDWNYYQELKKTNPKLYLDRQIAIQMHDDFIALGDAFGMPKD